MPNHLRNRRVYIDPTSTTLVMTGPVSVSTLTTVKDWFSVEGLDALAISIENASASEIITVYIDVQRGSNYRMGSYRTTLTVASQTEELWQASSKQPFRRVRIQAQTASPAFNLANLNYSIIAEAREFVNSR